MSQPSENTQYGNAWDPNRVAVSKLPQAQTNITDSVLKCSAEPFSSTPLRENSSKYEDYVVLRHFLSAGLYCTGATALTASMKKFFRRIGFLVPSFICTIVYV